MNTAVWKPGIVDDHSRRYRSGALPGHLLQGLHPIEDPGSGIGRYEYLLGSNLQKIPLGSGQPVIRLVELQPDHTVLGSGTRHLRLQGKPQHRFQHLHRHHGFLCQGTIISDNRIPAEGKMPFPSDHRRRQGNQVKRSCHQRTTHDEKPYYPE